MATLTESKRHKSPPFVGNAYATWNEWRPGDCALILTGAERLYQCSACTAKFSEVGNFRYCPRCGAFMEGCDTP